MTVQSVLTHLLAAGFGATTVWVMAVQSRDLAIKALTAAKLEADKKVGSLILRGVNQLDTIADLRGEVSQLTRDVKGEIERGDALYVEVLKLRAFKAKRNLSAKQRRAAILIPATSPGAKVMAA